MRDCVIHSTRVLRTFEEFRSPSVMSRRTSQGRHDVMARGSFEIDPGTGRVLAGEIAGDGLPGGDSNLAPRSLRAGLQAGSQCAGRGQRAYWRSQKPGEDRLEVKSTYSAFRRFEVSVSEQIKAPERSQSRRR